MARSDILLESGTNELEVLVFSIGSQRFGVNVAKVREVIEPLTITAMPETHECILGMFQLRDQVTPLIDLPRCLGKGPTTDLAKSRIVIMEFNDNRVGFVVHEVEQIYRVSWQDVGGVPDMEGVREAPLTSIAFIQDQMILMIDFERLVFEIAGADLFEADAGTEAVHRKREDRKILFAEDSRVMRTLIEKNLAVAGYSNVTVCIDGQEAWDALQSDVAAHGSVTYDLLISDIEMPRIDGLHLCKRIKDHAEMQSMPVVIFSSLVSPDNEKKCKSVGANAQITKPQLDKLVDLIDHLLAKADKGRGSQARPATV